MAQLLASNPKIDAGFKVQLPWTVQVRRRLRSSRPYYGALGIGLFFLSWYLLVDAFRVWRFAQLPGLIPCLREWLSPNPVYGISIFTSQYYADIWASVFRVTVAFVTATLLGVAIGVLMGWS